MSGDGLILPFASNRLGAHSPRDLMQTSSPALDVPFAALAFFTTQMLDPDRTKPLARPHAANHGHSKRCPSSMSVAAHTHRELADQLAYDNAHIAHQRTLVAEAWMGSLTKR
jgi:hypothetical protein